MLSVLGKSLLTAVVLLFSIAGSAQAAKIELPGVKVDLGLPKQGQQQKPLVSAEVDLGPKLPGVDAKVGGGQTSVQIGGTQDQGQAPDNGGSPNGNSSSGSGSSAGGGSSSDLPGSSSSPSNNGSTSSPTAPGATVAGPGESTQTPSSDRRENARDGDRRRGGRSGSSGGATGSSDGDATVAPGAAGAAALAESGEGRVVHVKDERSFPERLIAQVPAQHRGLVAVLLVLMVVCGLVAARERRRSSVASRQAARDPLTGLANRSELERTLDSEWKRATRHERPLGVLLLDLDNFKEVNDRGGHAAGDRMLKDVAAMLNDRVRDTDTVARLGGDEFVVVCPETSDGGLDSLASALRSSLAERDIGASIGTAELAADDASPDALIARADQAMYERKQERPGDRVAVS